MSGDSACFARFLRKRRGRTLGFMSGGFCNWIIVNCVVSFESTVAKPGFD